MSEKYREFWVQVSNQTGMPIGHKEPINKRGAVKQDFIPNYAVSYGYWFNVIEKAALDEMQEELNDANMEMEEALAGRDHWRKTQIENNKLKAKCDKLVEALEHYTPDNIEPDCGTIAEQALCDYKEGKDE